MPHARESDNKVENNMRQHADLKGIRGFLAPPILAWIAMACSILILHPDAAGVPQLGNAQNHFRITLFMIAAILTGISIAGSPGRVFVSSGGPITFFAIYGIYALFTAIYITEHALYVLRKSSEVILDSLIVIAILASARPYRAAWHSYVSLLAIFFALICVWWAEALIEPSEIFLKSEGLLGFIMRGWIPAASPNTIGFYAAALFFASACAIGGNIPFRLRAMLVCTLIISAGTFIVAQSRTSLGGLLFAVLAYVIVQRKYKSMLVAAGLICIVFSYGTPSDMVVEYASRGQSEEEMEALSGRTKAWDKALGALQDSILLGNGLVAYSRAEILGIGGTAALLNSPLEVLVGTGIVGFIPWLMALGWSFIVVATRSRGESVAACATWYRSQRGQMLGIFFLVIVRGVTSSSLAMHEHPFMLLLSITAVMVALKRGSAGISSERLIPLRPAVPNVVTA